MIVIRAARPDEVPAVLALYTAAQAARSSRATIQEVASLAGRVRAAALRNGVRVAVEHGGPAADLSTGSAAALAGHVAAKSSDRVVAAAVTEPARNEDGTEVPGVVALVALMVDPARWGRGIGAALLDAIISAAAEAQARALELWVEPGNEPAWRLYTARDFRPDPAGDLPMPASAGGATLIRMTLPIQAARSVRS